MKKLVIILLSLATSSYANIKIDIRSHSVRFADYHGRFKASPEVTIDCRAPLDSFKKAPLITFFIMTSRKGTGKIEIWKYYYQLDLGWGRYLDEGRCSIIPKDKSFDMPLCNYKKLSPKTLKGRGGTFGNNANVFDKKPEVLAYKTAVWLDGIVINEKETIKSSHINKGWDSMKSLE